MSSDLIFRQATFVGSASALDQCDQFNNRHPSLPEIAVVGRSNVGKSSLLNMLFQRKQLAKTSRTPGKTAALNYYNVGGRLLLVDLPGYGYAKISQDTKMAWGKLIDAYLNERASLSLILLLLDIRHAPSREDQLFVDWAKERGRPILPVFTKADKVSATESRRLAKQWQQLLKLSDEPILSSAEKGFGRQELASLILSKIAA